MQSTSPPRGPAACGAVPFAPLTPLENSLVSPATAAPPPWNVAAELCRRRLWQSSPSMELEDSISLTSALSMATTWPWRLRLKAQETEVTAPLQGAWWTWIRRAHRSLRFWRVMRAWRVKARVMHLGTHNTVVAGHTIRRTRVSLALILSFLKLRAQKLTATLMTTEPVPSLAPLPITLSLSALRLLQGKNILK